MVLLVVALITACGVAPAPPSAMPEPTEEPPSTTQPTQATEPTQPTEPPQQVTAGKQTYDSHCARCHGANLVDGFASKLTRSTLASHGTAKELFDHVRQTMPKGSPGSLKEQDYFDVISYLLFQQGMLQPDQVLDSDTVRSITLSE